MQQIEYFLAIFYDNIYTFFGFVIDYVITNFITIIEYIKNINYYALGLRLLILYSNVTSQTYKFCKKIWKK